MIPQGQCPLERRDQAIIKIHPVLDEPEMRYNTHRCFYAGHPQPESERRVTNPLKGAALGATLGAAYGLTMHGNLGMAFASGITMGATGAAAGYLGITLKQTFEYIGDMIP